MPLVPQATSILLYLYWRNAFGSTGAIDARAAIAITRTMGSGDMHVAVYDFGARKAYVAVGLMTANGTYGGECAFDL